MPEGEEVDRVYSMPNEGLVDVTAEGVGPDYQNDLNNVAALQRLEAFEREYGGMLKECERITGSFETNPMALVHHVVALTGLPANCAEGRCGRQRPSFVEPA